MIHSTLSNYGEVTKHNLFIDLQKKLFNFKEFLWLHLITTSISPAAMLKLQKYVNNTAGARSLRFCLSSCSSQKAFMSLFFSIAPDTLSTVFFSTSFYGSATSFNSSLICFHLTKALYLVPSMINIMHPVINSWTKLLADMSI